MLLHQSDLSELARCPAMHGYRRAGLPSKQNSAMATGSVAHVAVAAVDRAIATGSSYAEARRIGRETADYYWHPMHIQAVCDPVPDDGWLRGHNYADNRKRLLAFVDRYVESVRLDEAELLGTEIGFQVPVIGTWDEELEEPHRLAGSIDRLVVRWYRRTPKLGVDDWKSGQDYPGSLEHNVQGHAYCYATICQEFWTGWRGEDGFGERGLVLFEKFAPLPREFTWISLRDGTFKPGGIRGPLQYRRFALAVQQYADLVKADIFPLTISGTSCTYCSYRDICGGVGLGADEERG